MKMFKIVILFTLFFRCSLVLSQEHTYQIKGIVKSENAGQSIDSARVRIQGSNDFVLSDSSGSFVIITNADSASWVAVSAGKQGWYSKDINARVGDISVTISLQPLPDGDNMDYEFNDPEYCKTCHKPIYDQWKESKHANAAKNEMVLQLLNGTDIHGNENVAPGFKLDNPFKGGDCADCHAPTAAQWNPGNTDLNDVLLLASVDTNGVFCDFCHKISDVPVNYGRGINRSIILKRPSADFGKDINLGPLDDVTTFWMGATYSPIHTKSAFCSSCHQYANEAGIVVDDTYDSWAVSSYAAEGTECQDCHMKPFSDSIFVSGIGLVDAVKRDPANLYNHYFAKFGTTDSSETAKMILNHFIVEDTLTISVSITNKKAGHKLPTGVSIRNILFVLNIENGLSPIVQVSGDTLPHFAGIGLVEERNFSGFPGKAFALVTYDAIKNQWPSGNWAATSILFDSRIPAGHTDSSSYKFKINTSEPITINGELLYRAVYKHWADAKGWDTREYLMADSQFVIAPTLINEKKMVPHAFSLEQNYPNPFNAVTTIRFSLKRNSKVKIEIFSLSGELVDRITTSYKNTGKHSIIYNAENLSSGVYIYRLESRSESDFVTTFSKKMILLK